MTTPRLGAPELVQNQAVPETTVNEQVRYLEAGAGHFIFKDRSLATPPGSPADGDCYLVATSGTGAWSGHDGDIAFYLNTAWVFINAIEGFTAWVNDENVFVGYDGSAWNTLSTPSGAYLPITAILDDLADVNASTPADGDLLAWDNSAGEWVPVSPAGGGLELPAEWAPNFTDDGDVYIPAAVAMTVDEGNPPIGTGTLAYEKSTSGAPGTFSSTTLPATLQAGAWLKVSATSVTGFVAAHIVRTA